MTIFSTDFGKILSDILEKNGISAYQISQFSEVDQAYLSRLKSGEKKNPSPETVVKISLAICHTSDKVKLADIARLFNAIGRSLDSY